MNERKQFGAPLAAFQINQQKLVFMLGNVQAMILMGWRLCKLYEADKMTSGQASLAKVTFSTFQCISSTLNGSVAFDDEFVLHCAVMDHLEGKGGGFP